MVACNWCDSAKNVSPKTPAARVNCDSRAFSESCQRFRHLALRLAMHVLCFQRFTDNGPATGPGRVHQSRVSSRCTKLIVEPLRFELGRKAEQFLVEI